MNKHQVLKQYFGYDEFRDGQETLIDSILSGRDTLGLCLPGQVNRYVFKSRRL